MVLPRNSQSKAVRPARPKREGPSSRGWVGLKLEELSNLTEMMHEKFKWAHTPREFQMEAIKAQLTRKDVLVHAGTGSGKTTIAAGPHAHKRTNGMVTFMVSPLIALQEEQVSISYLTISW